MGKLFGAICAAGFALATISVGLSACGEVTEVDDQATCAQEACDRDGGAGGSGAAPERRHHGRKEDSGKGTLATASAPTPGDIAEFPCTTCVRAENCCKAEGLTDCNYVAACVAATPAEQNQFYLVLCRAVLSASSTGAKTPPDVCGF